MPDKKLVKDLKAKIEAVILAIPKEVEAYEFYMDLADNYENEASSEMFRFLAKQEMAHKDMLERLLGDLESQLQEALNG